MRVLIVKTSSMGDVLHTLPALTDARQLIPDICFDWVVEETFTQIPTWHFAVEKVIPCAIRRWRHNWFSATTRIERAVFLHTVQASQYDVVIDAQGLIKSALLVTRFAKGVRHGPDFRSAREALSSWFYQRRHAINPHEHAVERMRDLFSASLDYAKPTSMGDYAIAARFAPYLSSTNSPYLIFLHATTRNQKHWPEAYWRDLIAQVADLSYRIRLPWGAKHEEERAHRLAAGFSHVEVLPRLSLEQVARELVCARAVVSVDTGLSHLAAALDKPNLILYGPTDPKHVGGYGRNQFFCRPQESNYLIDLHPDCVFNNLKEVLDKSEDY